MPLETNRLIVAIDRSSRDEILRLADELHGIAGLLKIGLQAFLANGPALVRDLAGRGESVFLDLKLHDIPNTVSTAAMEAAKLGVAMLTLHAAGGAAMMSAAAAAIAGSPRPKLLGVTMLTSLGVEDLDQIGFEGTIERNVARLANLARSSGLDGVIASPREIALIRDTCGADLLIVTPGIRGASDPPGDQKRTMAPRDAVAAGADYIVVGRPITDATDRRAAARRILDELSR